ncbi:hypothetical protein T07_887 [Trichinella nelsoni]|uniref:Uncharacterized protein n=1 Tax=Trichinella nelsoni TaxID=6336 RepID=A0A0V0RMF1_9BILA|nr:hypothetical protein T07_887 [Trichinella nelsoni]
MNESPTHEESSFRLWMRINRLTFPAGGVAVVDSKRKYFFILICHQCSSPKVNKSMAITIPCNVSAIGRIVKCQRTDAILPINLYA